MYRDDSGGIDDIEAEPDVLPICIGMILTTTILFQTVLSAPYMYRDDSNSPCRLNNNYKCSLYV